jgi:poly(beta-D-mannuronate) lyase
LSNEGAATQKITGKEQSLFDGTRELKNWQLAWLEAYNSVRFDQNLVEMTDSLRPLIYSKLGGDQTLIWAGL